MAAQAIALLPASPIITPAPGPLLRRQDSGLWVTSQSSDSLASLWSVSCVSTYSLSSVLSVASKHSLSDAASGSSSLSSGTASHHDSTTTDTHIQPATSTYTVTTSTTVPATIYMSSTTILSSTVSLITATITSSTSATASTSTTPTSTATSPFDPSVSQAMDNSVQGATCVGHGLDSSGEGVLATAVITALVGLLIWVRRLFVAHTTFYPLLPFKPHLRKLTYLFRPLCLAHLRHRPPPAASNVCSPRVVCKPTVSGKGSSDDALCLL